MKVWIVLGSDGQTDVFALAAYATHEQAAKRVRRENSSQSYYEYRVTACTLYPKRQSAAGHPAGRP